MIGDYLSESIDLKEESPNRNKILSVKLYQGGVIKNPTTETLKLGSTIYFHRKSGTFIYGKQNLFHGAFGIVPNDLDGFLSSGDVPAFNFKSGINKSYFVRLVAHEYPKWEKLANGSGSKRIHEKEFLAIPVLLPSIQEQTRIENQLSKIDKEAQIEGKILENLISLKQQLLLSMFI